MTLVANRKSGLLRTQTTALLFATGAMLLTDMVMTGSTLSYGATAVVVAAIGSKLWEREMHGLLRWLGLFNQRYRPAAVMAIALGAYAFTFASSPADAQFFQSAQTWMQGQFPQGGQVIPLVFNVLRGLFIVYLGIALVRVVQAARNDEDWQTLARTPLIILITVTLGDVLAGFIIGGGGAGGAGA